MQLPNPNIQKAQNEFNETLKERLSAMPFPGMMTSEYQKAALKGLEFVTPKQLNLTAKEMASLCKTLHLERPLSYYEFAAISNNLDMRTMSELKTEPSLYFKILEENRVLGAIWKKESGPVQDKLMAELQEKYKPKQAEPKTGNGLTVVPGVPPAKA